ncbi:hypothetical protein LTR01_008814 [Friedmanniomyces endolithicus]|nr:hypothetical protein LTR01_008814 [Friedmanniomyces endolithicus]KAK0823222.1 hypothetical protein LTR73_008693 [Friedmanniomyces endolithicus]
MGRRGGRREESLPELPNDPSPETRLMQQQTIAAVARNCDGYWETNRIRRIMRRESGKRVGVPIGTSDWRQAYPAIHREFAINRDVVGTLDRIYVNENPLKHGLDVEQEQTREAIRAQQSGHSPQMEESIYGRQLQQNPFAVMRDQDAFREVSVDSHRFMQFPSSYEVQNVSPDVKRWITQERDSRKFERWQEMRGMDIDEQFKKMYGPQAQFRGKQREALEAIVSGHPRIVVVMRTGGGKSLLFMLPAAASRDCVTIVVMPKIMLEEDRPIGAAKTGSGRVVIAESAVSQSFADFVNAKMCVVASSRKRVRTRCDREHEHTRRPRLQDTTPAQHGHIAQ